MSLRILCLLLVSVPLAAQEVRLTIEAPKEGQKNAAIRVPLPEKSPNLVGKSVEVAIGTSTVPGLVVPSDFVNKTGQDLLVVAPEIQGKVDVTVKPTSLGGTLRWIEKTGLGADLKDGDRTVMQLVARTYQDDKDGHLLSFKVFHHLWDPQGSRVVTNGGHTNDNVTDPAKLKYPHHRGLMFAFNRISYGDKQTADTWHCHKGEHVTLNKVLHEAAGNNIAEHRLLLDWHGQKSDKFAQEERQMTVYTLPGGTLVDFTTRLNTVAGPVRLDGDPQHAGFQFRAHNDVAEKTAKQTYYLRPDGKGAEGETRNWEPKTKKGPVNLPWNVMSFVLDGQRYSVQYIDHPDNPGEKRYSERDYGRFGCYFEYDLTEDRPLVLRHRVWLQRGEMSLEEAQARAAQFVNPPQVVK